jgi:hypothetical protein
MTIGSARPTCFNSCKILNASQLELRKPKDDGPNPAADPTRTYRLAPYLLARSTALTRGIAGVAAMQRDRPAFGDDQLNVSRNGDRPSWTSEEFKPRMREHPWSRLHSPANREVMARSHRRERGAELVPSPQLRPMFAPPLSSDAAAVHFIDCFFTRESPKGGARGQHRFPWRPDPQSQTSAESFTCDISDTCWSSARPRRRCSWRARRTSRAHAGATHPRPARARVRPGAGASPRDC